MDQLMTWASDRKGTIRELKRLGEALRTHAKKSKIASAVGTGTSIVSGIGAVICFVAVPFTLGSSLAPAVGLTGLSIAGAATSAGSSIVNYLIEKDYMKDVQAALNEDRASFEELQKHAQKAKECHQNAGTKIPDVHTYGLKIPLPLDIIFFVRNAINLAQGNVSAAADEVLKLAKLLQEEYDEIMSEVE